MASFSADVNTYLIGAGKSRILIDTNSSRPYLKALATAVHDHSIDISSLLLTHWHEGHHAGAGHILQFIDSRRGHGSKAHLLKLPRRTDNTAQPPKDSHIQFLRPGDKIRTSTKDATLRVIATPGHASDHACFYLEEEDILISGDAISSTPYNPSKPLKNNPSHIIIEDLPAYLNSLKTLQKMLPRLVFPGHGDPIIDGTTYISEALSSQTSISSQIHTIIRFSPTPISTKQTIETFCTQHSITLPSQILPLKGTIKEHLLALEKSSLILRRHTAKLDTYTSSELDPTKIKGPGGLTMDKIFGHVQHSRRRDWEGLNEGERSEAVRNLKREREEMLPMHEGIDLGSDVCWVAK
ncbi:Beta-lactamase-like protein 2 [Rhizophlyctis rosea]|nr:Beta-lactamase-like protein 2 [Rhizophlyctis rosea]